MHLQQTARRGGAVRENRHTCQQRMDKQRAHEAQQADIGRYHNNMQLFYANAKSDARVDTLRRQRRIQQQNQELATAHMLTAQARMGEERQLLAQQDAALARALTERKSKQMTAEVRARRVCEGSEEIQQLKASLKAAQMNKVRSTQIVQKQLLTQEEDRRSAQMDAQMEADRRRALHYAQREAEAAHEQEMLQRADLLGQINERERKKRAAYLEYVREKEMVDEVVRGIEDDDALKLANHLAKQKELQANIKNYLEERRAWREQEVARDEEELQKIRDYQRQQSARLAELQRQKREVANFNDARLDKITAEIEQKKKAEAEMQQLLDELYQEEAEAKALEEQERAEQRRQQMKTDMIQANEFMKRLKAERAVEAKREEAAFRDQMMAKFAADKRLEQMNAARRRREMVAYKAEVDKLVAERRRLYEQALEEELADRRRQEQVSAEDQAIVERERQRLLREYATELGDYLPKGVFRDRDDYEHVVGAPLEQSSMDDGASHGKKYSNMFRGK